MISKNQVIEAQNELFEVVAIGSLRNERAKCEAFASDSREQDVCFRAGYSAVQVITKCAIEQFRATKAEHQVLLHRRR